MKLRRITIIITILVVLYGAGVENFSEQYLDSNSSLNFKIQAGVPLVINGDDDFHQQAIDEWDIGGRTGSKANPYLIQSDWIDASGSSTLKLYNISNTQVHFIIDDCTFLGGGAALYFTNVSNVVISNNWIEGSVRAFDFRNCSEITVYSNTILDFTNAFELTDCDDITIFSHVLEGGSYSFELNYVTNSLITNNWMNGSGIGAWFCDSLNISFNTILNLHSAIWFDDSCNNSILESNTIINAGTNGITLYDNCHYNNITNNNITHVEYYGIRIKQSNNTQIRGNTIDDIWGSTSIGILLNYASLTTIQDNNITNGTKYGLELIFPCRYNEISNNIIHGGETGLYIADSWVANNTFFQNQIDDHNNGILEDGGGNLYLENVFTRCYTGAYVFSNTNLTKNDFRGPGGYGVQINGEYNTIKENTISTRNFYGIYGYYGSRNNTLLANQIDNCSRSAIGLAQASNYTIIDNEFTNNYGDFHFYNSLVSQYYHEIRDNYVNGKEIIYIADTENPVIPDDIGSLILINCSYFEVSGQIFENVRAGVLAVESHDFQINHNLFRFIHSAVEMRLCENVTIENNEIYNCTGIGIWTMTADDVVLYNNQIHTSSLKYGDPQAAIYFYNVNRGYISTNSIVDCYGYAIRCETSEEVTIIATQIQDVWYGIYSNTDTNMSISNNRFQNCYYGIQYISSTYGEIFGNWIENSTSHGIYLNGASDNSIFLNNFIDNNQLGLQATDISGTSNSFYRNYWNDHVDNDLDSDGFKDSAYSFTTNSDAESLAVPYSISLPTLITPTSGEELNKMFTISWTAATDTLGYNIIYFVMLSCDGGESWQVLGSGLDTTSLVWEASVHINSTNCIFSVIAANDLLIYSEYISNPFTIINFGLSTPTIQFPVEGSTLGGTVNIQWESSIDLWNSSASVTYSVFYSSDDGATWTELTLDISEISFVWFTEELVNGVYLIKVIAANDEGLTMENIVSVTIENIVPTTTGTDTTDLISTTTQSEITTKEKSSSGPGFSLVLLFLSLLVFISRKKKGQKE